MADGSNEARRIKWLPPGCEPGQVEDAMVRLAVQRNGMHPAPMALPVEALVKRLRRALLCGE